MSGRLQQSLLNWRNNNPASHMDYAAEHLLQLKHHHVDDILRGLETVSPLDVVALAQQLTSGQSHVDALLYGNLNAEESIGG